MVSVKEFENESKLLIARLEIIRQFLLGCRSTWSLGSGQMDSIAMSGYLADVRAALASVERNLTSTASTDWKRYSKSKNY